VSEKKATWDEWVFCIIGFGAMFLCFVFPDRAKFLTPLIAVVFARIGYWKCYDDLKDQGRLK